MSVRRGKRRDPKTGAAREFWIVDVDYHKPDGTRERVRKVSPVQTRRGAEEYERQVRQALLSGTWTREKEVDEKKIPTFREFVDEFMRTYVAANNKPSERISKESIFRMRLVPALGSRTLDQISLRDIEALKASILAEGLAPKSVNNYLAVLGKTLRYACEVGLIESVPRIKLLKVPPCRFDFLDFDEYDRLLEAAKGEPEALAAILLAGDAGLRAGEIRTLQWDDIDFPVGKFTVQRTDYRGYLGSPKSGRLRVMPMTNRLKAALKAIRHLKGPFVFCNEAGAYWTRGEVDTRLWRSCRKAGLRKVGWHALRHGFCSHLAMKGAPARAIQELAGHATLTMTQRYMHLSPNATKDAIRLLEEAPLRQPDGNLHGSAEMV